MLAPRQRGAFDLLAPKYSKRWNVRNVGPQVQQAPTCHFWQLWLPSTASADMSLLTAFGPQVQQAATCHFWQLLAPKYSKPGCTSGFWPASTASLAVLQGWPPSDFVYYWVLFFFMTKIYVLSETRLTRKTHFLYFNFLRFIWLVLDIFY